jgi:hypothetical protein
MRRTIALAIAAILAVSLISVGAAAAKAPNPHANPSATTAVFDAHATNAPQGGSVKVMAKVRHCDRSKALSASASTSFGSATLERAGKGKSCVLKGRIPVPAGQAIGDYVVTVTVVYGGVAQPAITKSVKVVARETP